MEIFYLTFCINFIFHILTSNYMYVIIRKKGGR